MYNKVNVNAHNTGVYHMIKSRLNTNVDLTLISQEKHYLLKMSGDLKPHPIDDYLIFQGSCKITQRKIKIVL